MAPCCNTKEETHIEQLKEHIFCRASIFMHLTIDSFICIKLGMLSKGEFSVENKPKVLPSAFKIEDRATNSAKIQRQRITKTM